MIKNIFVCRRIRIEVVRDMQAGEHLERVGAEDLCIRDAAGLVKGEGKFGLGAQACERAGDARRVFGMTGLRISGAAFVSDDSHGKN